MRRPQPGITIPVTLLAVPAANTIEVGLQTGQPARIHLVGCDSPERNTPEGVEAAEYVQELLSDEDLWLHVSPDLDHGGSVLQLGRPQQLFKRLFGRLWIASELDTDLSEILIRACHAVPTDSRGS